MATDYAGAVRNGTAAAGRLQRELGIRDFIEVHGGSIDIFDAIRMLDLPLMLRPLKGLLGAYLSAPVPGILVTTERPMSIQRFTAAHELGHYILQHEPSLDDESVLRRMPNSPEPSGKFQEAEADAFAVAFMIPKWLIAAHCRRQDWITANLSNPHIAYQLSLRLGASYEATCRTFERYRLLPAPTVKRLVDTPPKTMKMALLRDYKPANYRGDVWHLTERDAGSRIDGSRNDTFVLSLKEHGASGFIWDFDALVSSGFAIVRDVREAVDPHTVGGAAIRRVTAVSDDIPRGILALEERRPWLPAQPLTQISLDVDLSGPEQLGLSRAERRHLLQAV
ncbi:MAG: ImmA/IrrE family metallo-endopeptidase [Sphingobium sp.]|nr:ImmA/IrrE family metallo-endopeptidase [Sphingobium sp.]